MLHRTPGARPPVRQADFMSSLGNQPSNALQASTSNVFSIANQAILTRFTPHRDITVTELHWFVHTVTNGNYDIGVYTDPGVRLWSSGSLPWPTASAVAVVPIAGGLTLTAGTPYYLALAGDNITGTWRGAAEGVANQIQMIDGSFFSKLIAASFPLPANITPGNTRAGKTPLITLHGS